MGSGKSEPKGLQKAWNDTGKGIMSIYNRATMAITVSGACVIGGLCYAIWTKNTDLVTFLAGAGIGFLLKDGKTEPVQPEPK